MLGGMIIIIFNKLLIVVFGISKGIEVLRLYCKYKIARLLKLVIKYFELGSIVLGVILLFVLRNKKFCRINLAFINLFI